MENTQLPKDFKEFLRLLNENEVRYLLIGGYAVGYYGYPRATHDMDVWIAVDEPNAERMVTVMEGFGFAPGATAKEIFLRPDAVVRMGVPPMRLEVLMGISGVAFEDCYDRGIIDFIDEEQVKIIHLDDLRANKVASGRYKDLDDISNLPESWPPETKDGE